VSALTRLRAFASAADEPDERCELCGSAVGRDHDHVADVQQGALRCVCRPCRILFDDSGAGGGRLRGVPDRVVGIVMQTGVLGGLKVPVGTAFVIVSSRHDRAVAFYPSSLGATEADVDMDAWRMLTSRHPEVSTMVADVEALLIHERSGGVDAFVVPVTTAYELVERVRSSWTGISGGEASTVIGAFMAELRSGC
jgi:hypothetical protein